MLRMDETRAAQLVRIALANVTREYPNHLMHVLRSQADALPPRALHPAFYGSYDWHSAVHSHWLLARLARLFPQADFAAEIHALLDRHLTAENIAAECTYFAPPERVSFERPYGLAWLLLLVAELAEWASPEALGWRAALTPLEELAAARFADWLPKLSHAVRSGEHSQSAFALALVHDWSGVAGDVHLRKLVESRSRDFYLQDAGAPLDYEPSGQDFLSPSLAEADLMRRVLPPAEFSAWLERFLPQLPRDGDPRWLQPVAPSDPADPKLAHLDGLNLSRAWMLEGIAGALPQGDVRRAALFAAMRAHAEAGLADLRETRYEGSHWLPSFAVYLLTRRGIARARP